MYSIQNLIDFLNSEIEYHSRKQDELATGNNPRAASKHACSSENFSIIKDLLDKHKNSLVTSSDVDLFHLDPLSLDDFPEELRSELSLSESDLLDAQVLDLLKIANRPLSLNELIIGAYRKYKIQHKRSALTARLYRLANHGKVKSSEKGVYVLLGTTPKPSEQTPDEWDF